MITPSATAHHASAPSTQSSGSTITVTATGGGEPPDGAATVLGLGPALADLHLTPAGGGANDAVPGPAT